jgi:hypothetical protein
LIEANLQTCDVVLVVWSQRARLSRWVLDEAERGLARGVLLPVGIDAASAPLGFGGLQVIDFSDWGADYNSKVWTALLSRIAMLVEAPDRPQARPTISVLPKMLALVAGWGVPIGVVLWAAYARQVTTSALGLPLVDALGIGCGVSTPVAIWSALEVRRNGFESLTLMLRRTLRWFRFGATGALAVIVAAIAAGTVQGLSAREALLELLRLFFVGTIVCAALATAFNIAWWGAMRIFGRKE